MLLRAIDRKLLRDAWHLRGQVITIGLVIASSVGCLIAMIGTYRALFDAREAYYAETQFPDVFAHAARVPDPVAEQLRTIPGVTDVRTRLSDPALISLPDVVTPIAARVISLPGGSQPRLDGLLLRRGRAPEPGRNDECVVLDAFAAAYDLPLDSPLYVTFGGRQVRLRVVGTVLSPEYVFAVGGGTMFPDDRKFTAVMMGRDAVAAGLGAKGAFDDVTLRLGPGAQGDEVVAAVDRILARYGGQGAILRLDQPSHWFVENEIQEMRSLAIRVPIVFLVVALFLIQIVLSRLVTTQREQIAALRALGYSRSAIARHYLAFAALVGVLGAAGGVVVGIGVGRLFTAMYIEFFRFPVLVWRLQPDLIAIGAATAIVSAAIGALRAVYAAGKLAPAEAMRPPAPARYRRGVLSRLGILRLVSPTGRLVVRELEHRPLRAGMSILGISLAMALLVIGTMHKDWIDRLADVQFTRAMPADLTIRLVEPVPPTVIGTLRHLPGVTAVEPMRVVPVRIRFEHRYRDLAIVALPAGGTLRQILDRDDRPIAVPARGVMLGKGLADALGVHVGERVEIKPFEGDRTPRQLVVSGIADESMGRTAYMDLDELHRALGQAPAVSGASLAISRESIVPVLREIAKMSRVASVTERRDMIEQFAATTASFTGAFTLVMVAFAAAIAVGVVYNHARVVLAERARELSTLRVLGFTATEVASSLVGELMVHLAIALPIGIAVSRGIAELVMGSTESEQYHFKVYIPPHTLGLAALVVCATAIVTAAVMARRVRALDPIAALKAQD